MKMSVVVCAYNEEVSIQDCLESLVAQTEVDPNDYEVIVIDDESEDRTGEVAEAFVLSRKGFPPLVRYCRIRHNGLSVARNTGLFKAEAPLIAYIDADATASPNWVFELLKAWDTNPSVDVIGGRVRIRNAESKLARFLHAFYFDPADNHAIIGANMSFRKERLLDVGAFGDLFVSRGDETFLLHKLGPERKEVKWNEAINYHDRPSSLSAWMKERMVNGMMTIVMNRICGKSNRLWLLSALKRVALVTLLLLSVLMHRLLPGILVLLLTLFLSLSALRRYRSNGIDAVGEEFNSYRFFLLERILSFIGMLCFSWGSITELFFRSGKRSAMDMWQGTVTGRLIIKELSTGEHHEAAASA